MAEVAEKIAAQLCSRGGHSLGGLRRQFKIMDDAGDKKLDAQDLCYGLQDFGLDITKDELQEFIAHADADGSGTLNFDEFITAMGMLKRNLLYTAVTRARRFCCVVTSPTALRCAVSQIEQSQRHTALVQRLQAENV